MPKSQSISSMSVSRKYGYAWITLLFFILTLTGHWIFGWFAHVQTQKEHGAAPSVSEYVVEMGRDTLENWQSEFLQLIWQVGGLALLLFVGSPQSKESSERQEAKIDIILQRVAGDDADDILKDIDRRLGR